MRSFAHIRSSALARSVVQRWSLVRLAGVCSSQSIRHSSQQSDSIFARSRTLRAPVSPPVTTSAAGSSKDPQSPSSAMTSSVEAAVNTYRTAFASLLEDRRMMYRDLDVADALIPRRRSVAEALLNTIKSVHPDEHSHLLRRLSQSDTTEELQVSTMNLLRSCWASDGDASVVAASNRDGIHRFYVALLSSDLVRTDTDIRSVMAYMSTCDGLTPRCDTYEAILNSLIALHATTTEDKSSNNNSPAHPAAATIVGQPKRLRRSEQGDLSGHYFGKALAEMPSWDTASQDDMHRLWGSFMTLCALTQTAPKLMDLWWEKLCCTTEGSGSDVEPHLPFQAVHAAVAWCAANRDIERGLRYFQEANKRGLRIQGATASLGSNALLRLPPGALTQRSADKAVQHIQLHLLAKLMAVGKSVTMDGGLRELVVKDVKRLIDTDTLCGASWGIINDVMSGLSMPSAMQLVKLCSSANSSGDGAVPFSIWASLLRRCTREHYIDEAEAMFLFIRKRFTITPLEKRELVEIMMRMYASLHPPDYASAMSVFTAHVLQCPSGEPTVAPDVTLYNILIKAADSRNTAMMTFLESCAAGVGMDKETFEGLLGSHPFGAVSSLSRKLPHDYPSSPLDAQLRIPADVDAHLRREEALKARGKPTYDSTGDAV